jgi:ATP-dependent RNA helicase RhlE
VTSFNDLGLAAPLLKALESEGYTTPTPIQAQAIPVVLAARDLVGIAQTGTGKTAAFALPILHRLAADRRPALRKGCRTLVLSPTRELAAQIAESFRTYGRHMGLSVAVVFGGVGHRPQIQALARGVDVLVATPGRLLDHMGERDADISGTEILVLDEADQMLDLGFIKPIRRIVSALSTRRQTLLFSATMPEEIASLARDLLRDPERIAVTPVAKTADRVAQRVIHVDTQRKRALLTEILSDGASPEARTLVFTRTKRGADRVAKHLDAAGISVAAIHGNKSQSQREKALDAFKASEIRVLVATDIAARGIDIDGIGLVVNYELPEVPEVYVHRIGRTARAGAEGRAITLCDREEQDLLRRIERLTRQTIAAESRVADVALALDATPAERGRRERGRNGDRRGGSARGFESRRGEPRDRQAAPDRRGGGERSREDGRRHRDDGGSRRHEEQRSRPDRGHRDHGEARARAGERDRANPVGRRDDLPEFGAPLRRPGSRAADHRGAGGHGAPRNDRSEQRARHHDSANGDRQTARSDRDSGRPRSTARPHRDDRTTRGDGGPHVPAFLKKDNGGNRRGGRRPASGSRA